MYADFESILEPIQGSNPAPTGSYTSDSQAFPLWLVTSIPPLVGVFTANSGTEKLRTH